MDALDELLERMNIEFPLPITAEEVKYGLIDYLRNNTFCNISYNFNTRGIKEQKVVGMTPCDEEYISEIRGTFARPQAVSSSFEMLAIHNSELSITFFKTIKFQIVPGYDSISEFESLPSGKEQLQMVDEIRTGVGGYFSERPK